MQTLGLQSEVKRSDGFLKSIFWPEVRNAWDVDYLGQQGFWICATIAAVQLIFGLIGAATLPINLVVGPISALLYFTGGMGVREKSWAAAAMILLLNILDFLSTLTMGMALSPGLILRVAILGLLFSNVRATLIASRWRQPAEDEDRPMRFSETLRDRLVDQWPPKLWPVVRVGFFALGALWILFSLVELLALALVRIGVFHLPAR